MAKWGEGDSRWKVDDYGTEGRNVNNWHWVERDCKEWSRNYLNKHFTKLDLSKVASDGKIEVKGVQQLDGEAVINIRKGKVIPSYEINLKVDFDGEFQKQKVQGYIHAPYIADENYDEKPEIKIVFPQENQTTITLKQQLLKEYKEDIIKLIKQFEKDFRSGTPVDDLLKPKEATKYIHDPQQQLQNNQQQKQQTLDTSKSTSKDKKDTSQPQKKVLSNSSKTNKKSEAIQFQEEFYSRPQDIFECFTNEKRIKGYTQSDASVSRNSQGQEIFKMYGGSVEGVITERKENQQLKIDWRFNSWADNIYSKVVLDFDEPEKGKTIVKIQQTGIPYEDRYGNIDILQMTENGWHNQIFQRIKMVFGYGV